MDSCFLFGGLRCVIGSRWLAGAFFLLWLSSCGEPDRQITEKQRSFFSAGDVVLVGSSTWRGWVVRHSGEHTGSFTHIGIVAPRDSMPESPLGVIHASPYGPKPQFVRWESLDDFLADPKITSWKLLRWQEGPADSAVLLAQRYLQNNTPFDDLFEDKNDSAVYCTELVARAYAFGSQKVPAGRRLSATILWFKRQLHFPDSFDRDSRFGTVLWVKNWPQPVARPAD